LIGVQARSARVYLVVTIKGERTMKKLAMFCLLILTVVAFAADKWIDQIQILMTEQEKADYKKLKSDADKQKFVADFWAKRDPTPGTPENEFKNNYETNFGQVNAKMKDKRAFESDMGQTLLLLGPPADQKQEGGKPATSGEEEAEGGPPAKQTWTFRNLPAEVASGDVTIEFRVSGGAWKFVDRKQAQALLEKARLKVIGAGQTAAQAPQAPAAQQAPAPPKPAASDVPPVTSPDVKAALDATATGSAPKDIPVNALVDSFMTSEGDVFSTFAINTGSDAGAGKVGIRVLDSTGNIVKETELPFVDAAATPAEPAGYFQSKLPITPGEYSVALAVSSGGKAGGVKKSLSVPQYTEKLAISSIILSKKFNQLTEAKPEKTPYTFGKIKVDPNTERVFTKADELILVYEAYNFQQDASGQANLESVITFQKGNDKPKPIPPAPAKGLPIGKKMTVPTSFALSETFFSPGEWKIKLTVTDKATSQSATQEANFTIK
jgi:GWxTD domain-containing protein